MPYIKHAVRQCAGLAGSPGAGAPKDSFEGQSGQGSYVGNGSSGSTQKVSGYTRKYAVRQANAKTAAAK